MCRMTGIWIENMSQPREKIPRFKLSKDREELLDIKQIASKTSDWSFREDHNGMYMRDAFPFKLLTSIISYVGQALQNFCVISLGSKFILENEEWIYTHMYLSLFVIEPLVL